MILYTRAGLPIKQYWNHGRAINYHPSVEDGTNEATGTSTSTPSHVGTRAATIMSRVSRNTLELCPAPPLENSIRVQVCLSNCTRIMDVPRNPYTRGRLHYYPYKTVVAATKNVIVPLDKYILGFQSVWLCTGPLVKPTTPHKDCVARSRLSYS